MRQAGLVPDEPTWAAPTASGPVCATVTVPGSKSQTARLLVLSALADGPSLLRRPLRSRDTLLMAAGLRALGTVLEDTDDGSWRVLPAPLRGPADVDVGLAGTVARFLPAVAALADGRVRLDGDARMRERPMAPLLQVLRDLGAVVEDGGRGLLPVTVRGTGALPGGRVTVDASASSQLVSGLLLAGPRMLAGIDLTHAGPPVPSAPHLAMTVHELRRRGADIDDATPDRWRVAPGPLHGVDVDVEPDLSTASAFLAAALATGGEVTLAGWPAETAQPGGLLPGLLTAMGAKINRTAAGLAVRGGPALHGLEADLSQYGEVVPTLAALAVLADGPSELRGVAHLRGQETDRLRALAEELGRLGARVRETDDGLQVDPVPLHGAELDPRGDHRLAMAYAVVALEVPGVRVRDVATVGKTVPDFVERWTAMLAGRHPMSRPGDP